MAATPIADPSILTNAQTPQTLQAWTNLLDSIFPPTTNTSQSSSGTTSSTTTTSSDANDPIKALLALLIPGATGGVNNPQTQAQIAQLLQQFKEGAGGLSGIQAAGNSAGVYNSSTQELLANDAMARAIAAASGVIGTQQNQQQQVIAQLLATLSAGSRTQNQTGTTTNQQQSSSGKSGGGGSALGKAALGAGAGAAAAKMLNKALKGPEYKGGQGRSDEQDDTSGMSAYPGEQSDGGQGRTDEQDATNFTAEPYNTDSDPAAFYGTEDAGANGFSDPNAVFDFSGFDLGDFVANDSSQTNFDFIDGFTGIDFGGGDPGGGFDGFDFTGGDF